MTRGVNTATAMLCGVFVAAVLCVSGVQPASADPYSVTITSGAFKVDSVTMSTPYGHWGPLFPATVIMKGTTTKR